MLTPSERSLRARAGAYALHAMGGTSTKAGTAAFLAKFEKQVDPGGTLPPEERARRATFALKSYMCKLELKASRARGRQTVKTATAVEMPVAVTSEVRHDAHDPTQ